MNYYDRLYGELKFPPIINELLDCPGLLRLRDVRMANNQFEAFPSFSNSSRYEHSLGVCYLAGICARSLDLPEKDTIELMIACLYHDVGTPPFAHAMEEVLQIHFGFDHEDNLRQITNGTSGSVEGNLEQVYLGATTKLRSVCHSKLGRKYGLDLKSLYRIADIIVGKKEEVLSPLLNGDGMDLDNIDNVIRASSAMGIIGNDDYSLPLSLAKSFAFDEKHEICYNGSYLNEIRRWQSIRDKQYTAIFESINDFSYQTMIKKALSLLLNDNKLDYSLSKDSWKLTDSSILYEYLLKNPKSRQIMKRVQLCKPFRCLGVLYVQGDGVSKFINKNIATIEEIASGYFKKVLQLSDADERIKDLGTNVVVANFYPDKRKRAIYTNSIFMGAKTPIDENNNKELEGALLGLFTSLSNSNYISLKGENEECIRKSISFTQDNLLQIMDLLKSELLQEYTITIYGRKPDDGNDKETSGYQLGFF